MPALIGARKYLYGSVPYFVTARWGALTPYIDLYADFTRGLYWIRGVGIVTPGKFISLAGSGTEYAVNQFGEMEAFATTVPAIQAGMGFQMWEGRTNKGTNYNAAPNGSLTNLSKSGDAAATLTEVDDTANLIAAGFGTLISQGVMNGNVFKLDNSAGVASAFVNVAGNAGNTNTHAVSAYVRGGTGTIGVQTGTSSSFTASATYQRRTHTGAGVSAFGSFLLADAGQTIYFILNVFEEGGFVGPIIVIAGAAVTRGARVPTIIGRAADLFAAAKSFYTETDLLSATPSGLTDLIRFNSNDARLGYQSSNSVRATNGSGGTGSATATLGSGATTGRTKTSFSLDGSSFSVKSNGGSAASSANAWVASGTPTLGNRGAGTAALNGRFRELAVSTTVKGLFDGATV